VDLNKWVNAKLSETISEFREADVTDSEIRNAFNSIMNERKI
jgi:hypothetical protein